MTSKKRRPEKPNETCTIKKLSNTEFYGYFSRYSKKVLLGMRLHYNLATLLTPEEMTKAIGIQMQSRDADHLYLGLFAGKQLVGWSCGFRVNSETFYINNSVVFPRFQRKGYHVSLLRAMIQHCSRNKYRMVTCHHYATLSSLIAKKLEMGFLISGIEYNDTHGVLVKMNYYIDPKLLSQFVSYGDSARPPRRPYS